MMDEMFIKNIRKDLQVKKLRASVHQHVIKLKELERKQALVELELEDEDGRKDCIDGMSNEQENNNVTTSKCEDYRPFTDEKAEVLSDNINNMTRDNKRLTDQRDILQLQLNCLKEQEQNVQDDYDHLRTSIRKLEKELATLQTSIVTQNAANAAITSQLSLQSPFLLSADFSVFNDIALLKSIISPDTYSQLESVPGECLDDKLRHLTVDRVTSSQDLETHIDYTGSVDTEDTELITLCLKFQDDLRHHAELETNPPPWLAKTTQNICSQVACIIKTVHQVSLEPSN